MNALTRPIPAARVEIHMTRGVIVKSPSFSTLAASTGWSILRMAVFSFGNIFLLTALQIGFHAKVTQQRAERFHE